MPFKTVDDLCRALTGLQLVDPTDLAACRAELTVASTPSELLRKLESKHLLTTYQVMRLEKGETDGLVLGRYKLLYRNASGSFARVYRVCSLDDGSMLGMKVLRQRWAEDPKMVALFRREAELGRKLKHRNIVPIHEIGSQGDYHYFTMDFIVGGNLRDFLNIRKKLSPVEATRYALDVAVALEYALAQGMTHRDLKLTNVLMDTNGMARLIDFGLAGSEGISGSGSGDEVQRALEYSTLEKATNAPPNDPRSDLFFLGTIYYELLTGMPPYPRTRSREERKRIGRYQNIRPVTSLDPNIPRCVAEVVNALLQFQPALRPQTPTEVVDMLRATLRELGESPDVPARTSAGTGSGESGVGPEQRPLPTIMCIEGRPKQQDILREYLSKRGFRVLVLSDVQRGLDRLRANPPDGIVLMGGSIGDQVVDAYYQADRWGRRGGMVCIAVLAEKQADLKPQLQQSRRSRVLIEPIQLRDLRKELHLAFRRTAKDQQ